jgi:hypothetical protein
MSGFTTENYQWYMTLDNPPVAGEGDNVGNTFSSSTNNLFFPTGPGTQNEAITWNLGDSNYSVTYTGLTVTGDPIMVLGATYYLLSDTVYPDSVTPETNDAFTCFCGGTLIQTKRGEVAVEDLTIGDCVVTSAGEIKPIRWIGRRVVRSRGGQYRFADPLLVNPIRFRAGALGDSLPRRDLLLSPEHAILIDDILVQAGALVNGVSILREAVLPEVLTYYHIELAEHALLLAEGVAAESFVDNVNRMSFENWAEHEALYGAEASITEMAYPRAQSYRQVPREIHARLMGTARADLAA